MRFEDWDVLLFPKDSKVPMKEFKTSCHVVHDTEFAYTHGSFGLPTMTCFMPGLAPGTPFNISLHSWKTPDISQFTQNYSKHTDLVKFEARVIVDGRLVATSSFHRIGPWPQLINHSFDFTKNGDLEVLKFPSFRSELLRQSYWSPADDTGRIKILISEGFPRDSLTVPIERVKNIVAFSFQHAPLEILESSGIAWPNPAMWRRGPFNPTMPVPTKQHEDGAEAHIHSPRRRSSAAIMATAGSSGYGQLGMAHLNATNLVGVESSGQDFVQKSGEGAKTSFLDPFNQNKGDVSSFFDWQGTFGTAGATQDDPTKGRTAVRRTGQGKSSSDTPMPDYTSSSSHGGQRMSEFEPMNLFVGHDDNDMNNLAPKAPTNTPTTFAPSSFVDDFGMGINKVGTPGNTPPSIEFFSHSNPTFSTELATSLTHSLLNQPLPLPVHGSNSAIPATEIKSRKENRFMNDPTAAPIGHLDHVDMRKVSQSAFSGLKGSHEASAAATNSPLSHKTFSGAFSDRSLTAQQFGNELTNNTVLLQQANADVTPVADSRIDGGGDKNVKRTRQFTPASVKAIDDEDEPRRSVSRGLEAGLHLN
ncbi:hypothetical protein F5Y16DRAFT_367005 [Xylariaceae sp. FL0255]|nr:hypothetical protein F5Y16DRAFT_367005 [Xylariaceae sp. FL0255]